MVSGFKTSRSPVQYVLHCYSQETASKLAMSVRYMTALGYSPRSHHCAVAQNRSCILAGTSDSSVFHLYVHHTGSCRFRRIRSRNTDIEAADFIRRMILLRGYLPDSFGVDDGIRTTVTRAKPVFLNQQFEALWNLRSTIGASYDRP